MSEILRLSSKQKTAHLTCDFRLFSAVKNEGLMSTMLEKGVLADATLICEDRRFPCHRAVLASASEVFLAMFSKEGAGGGYEA